MKIMVFAACLIGLCGSGAAAPLQPAECARTVPLIDRAVASTDLDVAKLVRDGDPEVAAAARRFQAVRSQVPRSEAALINAAQDLRYQLQVCAHR